MTPVLAVATLWLLFGGTHIGLGVEPIRGRLVARLGEIGFTAVFYLVAAASFAALVAYYATHRAAGPPGLAWAAVPALRWAIMLVMAAGIALSIAALLVYPSLPTALFAQPIRAPRGIERITRHPFFAGVALLAAGHTLLAGRLIGTVFFGAMTAFTIAGAWQQDRKLLARRGPPYADYLAATSAIPFAAIIAGRQRVAWRELPVGVLLLGVGAAVSLRAWHDAILADGGAWLIGVVLVGALVAGLNAWRRARRAPSARPRGEILRTGGAA